MPKISETKSRTRTNEYSKVKWRKNDIIIIGKEMKLTRRLAIIIKKLSFVRM